MSTINGKVMMTGGSLDGEDTVTGSASLSVPLGERFGLQLDGASGDVDRDDLQGRAAVHRGRRPKR